MKLPNGITYGMLANSIPLQMATGVNIIRLPETNCGHPECHGGHLCIYKAEPCVCPPERWFFLVDKEKKEENE